MENQAQVVQKIKRHRLLFLCTIIAITAYLGWRTFFTLPTRYGVVALLFGILLLLAEITSCLEAVANYAMLSHFESPEMPVIPEEYYPEVDIFIATHNEPLELLYSTINGCTFLDYPDKSKVHIHVCDDTDRPEMKALAEELGVNYWGLGNNKEAKGGNLNNALRQTMAPLCVTLDADMIPKHEFLMQTVPYFLLPKFKKLDDGSWVAKAPEEIDPDDNIGFLQTPQGFYNPDLFQYNLYSEERYPGEQDAFFREINVARSAYNASIYAGSNTIISRQALEDVDYIAVDTITEDILTGLRIQKLGYRCLATSEVLAHGQAPITVKSLIRQRQRWGRGNVDTFRQEPVLFSDRLSIAQKFAYMASYFFWWNYLRRFLYLTTPIVTILFNMMVLQTDSTLQVLVFWLPYYLLFNRSLRVMSGNITNQHWCSIADTVLFPYLMAPIIAEQLGIRAKKFIITEKKVSVNQVNSNVILGLPHLIFLIAILAAIVSVIARSITTNSLYNPIILFWLVIGAKNLIFALFFMWGRDNYRLASRFYFAEPVTISHAYGTWETQTSDVSETGLAFKTDHPEFVPEDTLLNITLHYRGNEINLEGRIVHIAPAGKRWKYSVHFEEMSSRNKRYYRAYVYDREHSLPQKIDPSVSILDDFNFRLGKRMDSVQESMRKLPRVRLDIPFHGPELGQGTLIDFNYRYASIQTGDPVSPGTVLQLEVLPGFSFQAIKADSPNPTLYQVVNSEALALDREIAALLSDLSHRSPKAKSELNAAATVIVQN